MRVIINIVDNLFPAALVPIFSGTSIPNPIFQPISQFKVPTMSTSGSTASLFLPGVLLKGRNSNPSPIQECGLTVMASFAVWDPMLYSFAIMLIAYSG